MSSRPYVPILMSFCVQICMCVNYKVYSKIKKFHTSVNHFKNFESNIINNRPLNELSILSSPTCQALYLSGTSFIFYVTNLQNIRQ